MCDKCKLIAERQRVMAAQVALKRKQAAEDAMALGLRMVAGHHIDHLPPGPVWDLPRNETTLSHSESDAASRSASPPVAGEGHGEPVEGMSFETLQLMTTGFQKNARSLRWATPH